MVGKTHLNTTCDSTVHCWVPALSADLIEKKKSNSIQFTQYLEKFSVYDSIVNYNVCRLNVSDVVFKINVNTAIMIFSFAPSAVVLFDLIEF